MIISVTYQMRERGFVQSFFREDLADLTPDMIRYVVDEFRARLVMMRDDPSVKDV
jgi:hypothetical protein